MVVKSEKDPGLKALCEAISLNEHRLRVSRLPDDPLHQAKQAVHQRWHYGKLECAHAHSVQEQQKAQIALKESVLAQAEGDTVVYGQIVQVCCDVYEVAKRYSCFTSALASSFARNSETKS